jgi:hypothetical protein
VFWRPGGGARVRNPSLGVVRRVRRAALSAVTVLAVALATAASALGLPDGRAYELVSPPNKGGYEVSNPAVPGDARAQASITGDAVTFGAAGAFPGTDADSASQFVTYLAMRPPGGQDQWRTKALTAPLPNPSTGGLIGHGGISDLSADLLLGLTPLEGVLPGDPPAPPERNPLYLRDNVGDGFELLTPGLVPFGPGIRTESRSRYLATADFDHLVWQDARRGVATDTLPFSANRVYESFVNDQGERELRLASILPDGSQTVAGLGGPASGGGSTQNTVSADGDRIFFTVGSNQLYVRENGTTTTFVGTGRFAGAARDGSKVFAIDVIAGDRPLTRYDVSSAPVTSTPVATGVQGVVALSQDGSRFYFSSTDQLVPEAPATGNKLYLWEDAPGGATTTFVAPLSDTDGSNWEPAFTNRTSRVTADGEHLLFVSSAQVTAFDNQGTMQVYLYRLGVGVECVSCPSGPPTADASLNILGAIGTLDEQPGNLTEDGRRVFFQTREALVPADGNGRVDVYQYDVATKQVALISTGQSGSDSTFADASPEGDDVFFATRQALVGWDQDGVYDVYDARVGGGLPEPPEPPTACSGDECQGLPSGSPGLVGPSTSLLHGLGDPALAPRPAFRLVRLSRAQISRLARTGKVTLPVRVNRAGRVSLTGRAKMGARSPIVARSSRRASKAGTVGLTLKLSKAARRQLARARSLKVSVSVRFAGIREAKRMVLSLRQPRTKGSSRRAAATVDRKAR